MDEGAINEAIEDTAVGIYVLKEHAGSDEPEDIGIVLEGIKVLQSLDNVALAVAMLFGLIYALNLDYPADLRYTFEAIQKIFMEMDAGKLSRRALALKNRLFNFKNLLNFICRFEPFVNFQGITINAGLIFDDIFFL
uniref:Uncharacterized protein n=1 Tax=Salarias fasciatus TaxID=181472 RepID=A0A672G278_SALFA